MSNDNATTLTDSTAQQAALLKAAADRKRGEKNRFWKFRFRNQQHPPSPDSGDDMSNDFDTLSFQDQLNNEQIQKLKREIVQLNLSFKEDTYLNKKKIESLESEKSAYELKITVLEQELERLANEVTRSREANRGGGQPANANVGADNKHVEELEGKLETLRREKADAEEEIESLQTDFDELHRAFELESSRNQKEIVHLKTIREDLEQKVAAFDNLIVAISEENSTLREMAQQKNERETDSGRFRDKFSKNEKDVKIAQLNKEVSSLRLELDSIRHEDLKSEIKQLREEKDQAKTSVEKQLAAFEAENRILIDDLQMRLRAREHTIKNLEMTLEGCTSKGSP
mmetsp:Transcript_16578/g.38073  ORF Transcript_16578/g.38073 Transcript_16578/m.38073 type:complete len:343 (+) Transcript_16578:2-1030(+)